MHLKAWTLKTLLFQSSLRTWYSGINARMSRCPCLSASLNYQLYELKSRGKQWLTRNYWNRFAMPSVHGISVCVRKKHNLHGSNNSFPFIKKTNPYELHEQHIKQFLTSLAVDHKVSASMHNQAVL